MKPNLWVNLADGWPKKEGKYLCLKVRRWVLWPTTYTYMVLDFKFYRRTDTGARVVHDEHDQGVFLDDFHLSRSPDYWRKLPPLPKNPKTMDEKWREQRDI